MPAKKVTKKPVKKIVKKPAKKVAVKKPVKKTKKVKKAQDVMVTPVVAPSGVVTMNPVLDDMIN